MQLQIRSYESTDLSAVSRICLRTSDNGQDGTKLYSDPELPGLVYTSPYVVFEPNLAFVLVHESGLCGYVMGTLNTHAFYERCERDWFPALRSKYPLMEAADDRPEARIIRMIHEGRSVPIGTGAYPAHMHLDLLPIAQGLGWGRKMMETLIDRLIASKVSGVHLDVGSQNKRAIGFYEHLGFHAIRQDGDSLLMGRLLDN